MVTYKHVAEDDIVDSDKNACLCNLSLLNTKGRQKIVYAGNIYRSDCINFWVNSITALVLRRELYIRLLPGNTETIKIFFNNFFLQVKVTKNKKKMCVLLD